MFPLHRGLFVTTKLSSTPEAFWLLNSVLRRADIHKVYIVMLNIVRVVL